MKIAVQMDAIESINIKSDTTFVLMLEAFRRGFEVYYYQPHNMSMLGGEVVCTVQKIYALAYLYRVRMGDNIPAFTPEFLVRAQAY